MKLHTEAREVVRGGELIESEFKIKSTPKAFAILSSGLYTNKILAIIRELACNAYDAHVAAGKTDVPIEIKFPNSLDPTFYVKDFGIGLDHDGVVNVYTTYFESTKQDSNEYIGALGLGSKSPFSYVPSFNIEARKDGIKRFYTAFINDDGIPAIAKMSEVETDECNGLTVSLQAKRDDHQTFAEEARKALMYFDPQPVTLGYHNFQPHYVKHTLKGDGWMVREASYWAGMSGLYVQQGFVTYPIDNSILLQHGLSEQAEQILGLNLDLTVPIGAVEVAASREGLSYTKQTIKYLAERLETIVTQLYDTIQKSFDDCSTLWEAAQLHSKLIAERGQNPMAIIFHALETTKPFTWNDHAITSEIIVSVNDVMATSINVMFKTLSRDALQSKHRYHPEENRSWHCTNPEDKENPLFVVKIAVQPNMAVIIDDMNGANEVIRQWIKANNVDDTQHVVVLRPINKHVVDQSKREIANILDQLQCTNPHLASALGFEKKARAGGTYVKKLKNAVPVWNGFTKDRRGRPDLTFKRACWGEQVIDFADGGFFIPIVALQPETAHFHTEQLDRILSTVRALGIWDKDGQENVYGFNEKHLAAAHKEGKWVNLFDHLYNLITTMNSEGDLAKVAALNSHRLHRMVQGFTHNWNKTNTKINDGPFKSFLEKFTKPAISLDKTQTVANLLSYMTYNAEVEKQKQQIEAEWKQVQQNYPLLPHISFIDTPEVAKAVVQYVNFIDQGTDGNA